MMAEASSPSNAPPPTLLFLLGLAALRGLVTAVTLAVFGVSVQAILFGVDAKALAAEALFDLFLAFFVAAPAAVAEVWVRRRSIHAAAAGVLVGVVAFLGATAAFLQVQYAEAVIRTRSLAAGIEALVTGAGWLRLYGDLFGLFAGIALLFGLITVGRVRGDALEHQLRLTLVGAIGAGFVLALTGAQGPQLQMSGMMILLAGLALPPLYSGCDSLEARFRESPDGA